MQVFKTVNEIQQYFSELNPKSIGFVPTMGALHKGHISLLTIAKAKEECIVCSIFVNPKQFNKKEDLVNYPRNIDADILQLEQAGCDVVFIPSVEEIYSTETMREFNFGVLSEVMEAEHRPGHFNGVAMVIERFFDIIRPTSAYFGEKDFQQLAVINALVNQLAIDVEVVGCPIYREASGLAMSSRNERLTEEEKTVASEISKALTFVSHHKQSYSVAELKAYFMKRMKAAQLLIPEYFEIADKATLQPIQRWEEAQECIAFTAVNVSGVRLIDNMTIIN